MAAVEASPALGHFTPRVTDRRHRDGERAAAGPPGPCPPLCPPACRPQRVKCVACGIQSGLAPPPSVPPSLIACAALFPVCAVGAPRRGSVTGPWISLGAYDSLHRPGLRVGSPPSSLGQEGWLLSLVSVGGPVRTLCSAAVWTQAAPLDAAPGRSWRGLPLCPVPSAFLWCWFVRVCLPRLLGLAAESCPWGGSLWKVWEALVTAGPYFLPGHGLGFHVPWSSGRAPSPSEAPLLPRSHPVPRPRAGLMGPHSSVSPPLRPPPHSFRPAWPPGGPSGTSRNPRW